MTPFGKETRRLRKERDLMLGDVAERIGVTSSYLSQIETGTKGVPEGFVEKLVKALRLNKQDAESLETAAIVSAKEFRIRLKSNASQSDKLMAHQLAMGFARLSPTKKLQLLNLIREEPNG